MDEKNLLDYLAIVPDPRVERTRKHGLADILFMALCAVLCGAESWTHTEEYAKANELWFRQFLDLPNGIPSHDTFGRVFAALDPDALEQALSAIHMVTAWVCENHATPRSGKDSADSSPSKANGPSTEKPPPSAAISSAPDKAAPKRWASSSGNTGASRTNFTGPSTWPSKRTCAAFARDTPLKIFPA